MDRCRKAKGEEVVGEGVVGAGGGGGGELHPEELSVSQWSWGEVVQQEGCQIRESLQLATWY
jgi:hypothetical protein